MVVEIKTKMSLGGNAGVPAMKLEFIGRIRNEINAGSERGLDN